MDLRPMREQLIAYLLSERQKVADFELPGNAEDQRFLLRALMNIRKVDPLPAEIMSLQDDYLKARLAERGVVTLERIPHAAPNTRIWRGDITTLACDAIVNAANSGMTGCWVPGHQCIDNAIHSYAGMQLRAECARIMFEQGYPEPAGKAKVTDAYNLPCRRVIHTVGPQVVGPLTQADRDALAQCYRSCYEAALSEELKSIAFCCISTGLFGFPRKEAARIAVQVIGEEQAKASRPLEVCFNVFTDEDEGIYRGLFE